VLSGVGMAEMRPEAEAKSESQVFFDFFFLPWKKKFFFQSTPKFFEFELGLRSNMAAVPPGVEVTDAGIMQAAGFDSSGFDESVGFEKRSLLYCLIDHASYFSPARKDRLQSCSSCCHVHDIHGMLSIPICLELDIRKTERL
jgi:hypothetical protein